jgi:S-adenosylmethionine:tRNA ribosyltransferase-isomerase
MHIKEFDYYLPPELVAQYPIEKRDHSRLMVLHREIKTIEHRFFFEITDYFRPGDVLVLNDTKVIPARLMGKKQSGGKVEVLLLRPQENGSVDESTWHCLINCSKKPKLNSKISFGQSLTAEILEEEEESFKVRFKYKGTFEQVLDRIGITPLPPYIKRNNGFPHDGNHDRKRYQTIFARSRGAIAAPTAGLHFTSELLDQIKAKGVKVLFLTLHVGWGTFQPVRVEQIEAHRMHSEYYTLSSSTAKTINDARKKKARIVSVGSTTTRCLEYAANGQGTIKPRKGYTDLFIYSGYRFKATDSLITNFHIPRSTLLILVSAFAGKEFILKAYHEAIKNGYHFYSYGDAMLII